MPNLRAKLLAVALFPAGVVVGILLRPTVVRVLYPYVRPFDLDPAQLPPSPPSSTLPMDSIAPSPVARFESAAIVSGGKLYLMGGFREKLRAIARCDVYDPATGKWTILPDLPVAVTHAGIAEVAGRIWIAGGFQGDHPGPPSMSVWVFDTASGTWSHGPSLPEPRGSAAMAAVDGKLHFFGGVGRDRDTDSALHWVLDTADTVAGWKTRAPFPNPRNHLSAVVLNGRIHAIGGQHRHDTAPLDEAAHHVYDPTADSWSGLAPLPMPRSHCEAGTMVHAGRIIVAGGRALVREGRGRVEIRTLHDIDAYDPSADRWSALPGLPVPMRAPVARIIGGRVFAGAGGLPPDGITPSAAMFSFPVAALESSPRH